ncbi:MAG: hypothetical protein ACOCX4_03180, partial [Planctomycetota bacterium]
LLFPALERALEASRESGCRNNLKQQLGLLELESLDNHNAYAPARVDGGRLDLAAYGGDLLISDFPRGGSPAALTVANSGSTYPVWYTWFLGKSGYLSDLELFRCPSDRRTSAYYQVTELSGNPYPGEDRTYFACNPDVFGRTSYTMNAWLSDKRITGANNNGADARWRAGTATGSLADPAHLPVLFEYRCCAMFFFGHEVGEWTEAHAPDYLMDDRPNHLGLEPKSGQYPGLCQKAELFDFGGRAMTIGYLDGHVEKVFDTKAIIDQGCRDSTLTNLLYYKSDAYAY